MREFVSRMVDPSNRKKNGTARSWFESHGVGASIETLQLQTSGAWYPGTRSITALTSSKVSMNGSDREFKGVKVVHATDTELMVQYDFNGEAFALYRAV
jgi:hypothetical protein